MGEPGPKGDPGPTGKDGERGPKGEPGKDGEVKLDLGDSQISKELILKLLNELDAIKFEKPVSSVGFYEVSSSNDVHKN